VSITFPEGSFFEDTTISIEGVPDSILRETELDGNSNIQPNQFILTPPVDIDIPDNTFGGTVVTLEFPTDSSTVLNENWCLGALNKFTGTWSCVADIVDISDSVITVQTPNIDNTIAVINFPRLSSEVSEPNETETGTRSSSSSAEM
jgi:hypothetical protein